MAQRHILVVLELRALAVRQHHGRALRLPPRDGLGLARLPDHVDGLADADVDLERLQRLVERDEHPRRDRGRHKVQQVVLGAEQERLGLQRGDQHGQQARGGDAREDRALPVERAEREGALAEMDEPLRDADHEEGAGVADVVAGELAEELGEAGVVGAGAEEAHGEDGVDGHVRVGVVGVAREGVVDFHLRVRGADEAERQRDRPPDVGRAVVH